MVYKIKLHHGLDGKSRNSFWCVLRSVWGWFNGHTQYILSYGHSHASSLVSPAVLWAHKQCLLMPMAESKCRTEPSLWRVSRHQYVCEGQHCKAISCASIGLFIISLFAVYYLNWKTFCCLSAIFLNLYSIFGIKLHSWRLRSLKNYVHKMHFGYLYSLCHISWCDIDISGHHDE